MSQKALVGGFRGVRFRRDLRLLYWGAGVAWLAFLAWAVATLVRTGDLHLLEMLPWLAVMILFSLVPVRASVSATFHAVVSADVPLVVAAGLVLGPTQAALMATLGLLDSAEWQGRIRPARAIFNRTCAGLAAFCAAEAAHLVSSTPSASDVVLLTSCVALVTVESLSFGLQCASVVVERGFSIKATAKRMLPGSLRDYGLALATWGSLAAMLVVFYDTAGLLALVAFVPVALLARQTLARSQALLETKRAFADREDALVQLSQHIIDERADERQLIAGQLHDDVLQALFKVTLMGEVLKRDLTMGRLLDLETDLREMAEAGEAASAAVRDVISNVRKSDLGTGTVADAIKALLGRVSSEATIRVSSQIGELRGDPRAQLTVYQITKEAIENATRHSRCDSLDVWLRQDSDRLALVISDDGVGFDPAKVADGHYGLQIMRERAQSASGSLYIDSWPGQGCKVTAILPTDPSPAPRSG